jgi:hypothetical protein
MHAEVEWLRIVLEVFFGDVALAADWHLNGEERLQFVRLIPCVEAGRSKQPTRQVDSAAASKPPVGGRFGYGQAVRTVTEKLLILPS